MMRALSLTQPWASWGILALGKSVENRQRWKGCSYRGEVALHAAKGIGTRVDFSARVNEILRVSGAAVPVDVAAVKDPFSGFWIPSPKLPRGAIVGMMRIAGVVTPDGVVHEDAPIGAVTRPLTPAERRWWQGGFALLLADVRALSEPVPCKGALGLWRVPAEIEAEVRKRDNVRGQEALRALDEAFPDGIDDPEAFMRRAGR